MIKRGFSLLEMAVVMVIIGLVMGSLLMPLSSQLDRQRVKATDEKLSQATEALMAFAVVNGRLPCPATDKSNGVEVFEGTASPSLGGACKASDGYLPAVTLGLTGTKDGFWLDAWARGDASRIHYAVAQSTGAEKSLLTSRADPSTTAYPAFGGVGIATLLDNFDYGASGRKKGLRVCRSVTGMTSSDCGAGNTLANSALFVVYSLGKIPQNTTNIAQRGANEAENIDADSIFISALYSENEAGRAAFDDQIQWVSSPLLFNRMIAAGQLQ